RGHFLCQSGWILLVAEVVAGLQQVDPEFCIRQFLIQPNRLSRSARAEQEETLVRALQQPGVHAGDSVKFTVNITEPSTAFKFSSRWDPEGRTLSTAARSRVRNDRGSSV